MRVRVRVRVCVRACVRVCVEQWSGTTLRLCTNAVGKSKYKECEKDCEEWTYRQLSSHQTSSTPLH